MYKHFAGKAYHNLKNIYFDEKGLNSESNKALFLNFMTTIHNFAYVLFIHG